MAQDGSFEKIITVSRNAFNAGKTRPLAFRIAQLRKFATMLEESRDEIEKSVYQDLRKHKMESILYEVESLIHECEVFIKNLKDYAKPDDLPFNLVGILDSGKIEKVPYGVVLIMGAWNYPFLLTLQPMIGAIAAGNCVLVKPSEVSPSTANCMARIIPKYLDTDCYHVIEANPEETSYLLQFKFDYIFYTGSTNVGRLVAQAAANHLTPTTLELGGKSPVYIDDNADYENAAKRVLWGRFANCGQTCIAPDYLMCSKNVEAEFITTARKVMIEWYNGDAQTEKSFGRIVNERHCLRLKQLLDTTRGNIVIGGKVDVQDHYVEPTIVVGVTLDDPLMQEEIFGPILPIVTVNSVLEAISIINSRPRPLALYSFSKNPRINTVIKDNTLSGGVCLNDTIWHCVWNGLPFGGIGDSGMGNYHGKFSFDTFTHKRSVLSRSLGAVSEKMGDARYPPYTENKIKMLTFVVRHFLKFNVTIKPYVTHGIALLIGVAITAAFVLWK